MRYQKEVDGYTTWFQQLTRTYQSIYSSIYFASFQLMAPQTTYVKDEARIEDFRLVSSLSLKQARTSSRCVNDNKNMICGMRVNLTFSFSVAGIIAPFFISTMALSIGELPEDNCLFIRFFGVLPTDTGYVLMTR